MAANYEGIATMYLSMPMAAQSLPILGSCSVQDKKISLKFPLSSVSFDLPEAPVPHGKDLEFKMAGPRGELTLKITYKADLQAFFGKGVQENQNTLTLRLLQTRLSSQQPETALKKKQWGLDI